MAVKIDKKELEEPDKLQIFFLSVWSFVGQNRTAIYAGTGVFFLFILLTGGWYVYQLNYEANAGKIYANTLETAMKTGSPAGDIAAIKGYKDLIDQYPRSVTAIAAFYKLGNLYFNRNEFDAAINAYQELLNKARSDSDLIPLAYNGMGNCYLVKKDFNKAIELFENALKTNTGASFEAMNYGSIANAYEAMNNQVKAVEFYGKALGKTKDPLMTLYLKRKLSIL